MKKLFALLLALMMIFSLAACGDNNTTDPDKDNPGVSQSGEGLLNREDNSTENNDEIEPYSLAAFERVLAAANLELSDIEPDFGWKIKSDNYVYGEDPSNTMFKGNIYMMKESGEITDAEYRAWVEKLFAATAAASDDGYNIVGNYFKSEGEDPNAEVDLETAMTGFENRLAAQGWAFRVGDETFSVWPSREKDKDKASEIDAQYYYDSVFVKIHD